MKNNIQNLRGAIPRVSLAILVLIVGLGITPPTYADSLYVGDNSDNTVKSFDADTGAFLGEFVKKGNSPIKGAMGLIFNSDGNLLVSNQNVGTKKRGEILKHNGTTGEFLGALVRHNDPNAPIAPRGIVIGNVIGNVLFIADTAGVGKNNPPGKLLAYTEGGVFLADLTPDSIDEFPGAFSTDEFHPRGEVFGPDGFLYISVTHDLDPKSADFNPIAGWILRFDPNANGAFVDVFASNTDAGCATGLHRPEGLVFGPDGRLYVTAFRANPSDTDKILVFDDTGVCVDQIDLYDVGQQRVYAQALLFGPENQAGESLFIPISGGGPDTGAVRRYNVTTKTFSNFVPPAALGGPLGSGWYLTFGKTDPGTLEYKP